MIRRVTGVQPVDLPPSGHRDVRELPTLCQSCRDLYSPLCPQLILVMARDVHAKRMIGMWSWIKTGSESEEETSGCGRWSNFVKH